MEPFGHDLGLSILSTVAAMYANAHKKKGSKTVKPSDFYSKTILQTEKQSPDDMKSIMMALVKETSPSKPAEKRSRRKVKKNG